MEPTLKQDRLYFINRLIYRLRAPKRGDIVVVKTTERPPLFFIKRVVGLPGEMIMIKEGKVFVDGRLIEEPYAAVNPGWNLGNTLIKKEQFFVIDDNRTDAFSDFSCLSVAYRNIVGRIMRFR